MHLEGTVSHSGLQNTLKNQILYWIGSLWVCKMSWFSNKVEGDNLTGNQASERTDNKMGTSDKLVSWDFLFLVLLLIVVSSGFVSHLHVGLSLKIKSMLH